tara:strand:- start:365 stop:553 length:189 start_codon:yes stop_codon:yes gene_type:complete
MNSKKHRKQKSQLRRQVLKYKGTLAASRKIMRFTINQQKEEIAELEQVVQGYEDRLNSTRMV